MQLKWQRFPKSGPISPLGLKVVEAFAHTHDGFTSFSQQLSSNQVLRLVGPALQELGFRVETGKTAEGKIPVPVLFGENGRIEKAFYADCYHPEGKYMLEIEAGRAVDNHQFLKDLFQACASDNVDKLAIAVRNKYRGSDDFGRVCAFMETLFASRRLTLPLNEILIIGS